MGISQGRREEAESVELCAPAPTIADNYKFIYS